MQLCTLLIQLTEREVEGPHGTYVCGWVRESIRRYATAP